MIVPTLKQQQVGAEALAGPYQSADVSALSQGGGVASGLSSLGGDLADHAIKAKKQADQAAEFEATADINDAADALHQDVVSKDGPALMQAYEGSLAEFDRVTGERLSRITSEDARAAAAQNARTIRGTLDARNKSVAEPKIFKASVDANQRLLGSYGKSITLAVANGGVRYSSTPSLPASVVGADGTTGSEAPEILDERAIAPQIAAAHAANVKFAEANAGQLGTDQESYVQHADALWRQDAYKAVVSGLLTRGDDRTARAFFESHKADFDGDDIDNLDGVTAKAETIGTSQRAAASAWVGADGETISARRQAAVAALPKSLSDDERAGAVKMIDQSADGARAQQTKQAGDVFDSFDTALQQGANVSAMSKTAEFQWLQRTDPAKARGLIAIGNDIASGGLATTDDAVYAEVQGKINDADPASAAAVNPREYVGRGLSTKDAESLTKQAEQKQKLGVGTLTPNEVISQSVSALYNADTIKDSSERAKKTGAFQRAANDAIVWAQSQQKTPVTTEQVQAIVDELSAATLMKSWALGNGWGTAVDLTTEAGGVVPAQDMVRIVDEIKRAGGVPSRAEILRRYALTLDPFGMHDDGQ